jgi:cytochrome P450
MMNADKTFEVKNVILGDFLNNLFPQLLAMVGKREEHPISVLAGMLFGIDLDFGPMAATVKANFAGVREFIRGWVQGRRDGYNSSQINGADMLSLMFESPDIFDDDSIVDEVLEFFVAVLRST